MKAYIASPFFNEKQLADTMMVEKSCQAAGWDYYSPRLGTISKEYGLLREGDDPHKIYLYKNMVFAEDIIEIDSSDVVMVNYDGKDSGTLFELGYALVRHKLIVCSSDDPKVRAEFRKVLAIAKSIMTDFYIGNGIFLIRGTELIKLSDSACPEGDCATVIAEHDGKPYLGLSKILLGILYAKNESCKITYVDVPRKSNLMLTSSVDVYECKDLSIFDETNYAFNGMELDLDDKLSKCTPVMESAKDE